MNGLESHVVNNVVSQPVLRNRAVNVLVSMLIRLHAFICFSVTVLDLIRFYGI